MTACPTEQFILTDLEALDKQAWALTGILCAQDGHPSCQPSQLVSLLLILS